MNLLMPKERRLYPRYSVDIKLDIDIEGNAEEPAFSARVGNLSQNGVNIICSDADNFFVVKSLSYSDEYLLHFPITEDHDVMTYKTKLSIKRRMSSIKNGLGFHFLNMTSEQEQSLDEYLYSLRSSC